LYDRSGWRINHHFHSNEQKGTNTSGNPIEKYDSSFKNFTKHAASLMFTHFFITKLMALPTANMKEGKQDQLV
jgi:hypothetical protein